MSPSVKSDSLFRLDGRVTIVTGASSGLGVAMATGLAEAGTNVVIAARRIDRLEKLAEQIRKTGVEVLPVACDVSDPDSLNAMVDRTLDTPTQMPAAHTEIRCWRISDRTEVGAGLRLQRRTYGLALSPAGELLLIGGEGRVELWTTP